MPNFEPTEEQRTIVDFAKDSDANVCINALAGAAKTTTLELICHAVTNIPILSLAFNKRIADELSKRLPPHVECRTFNALGHRVWSAAINRRLTVNTNKMHERLSQRIGDLSRSLKEEAWEDFADTLRWLRIAKRDGYVPWAWRGIAKRILTEDWSGYDEEPTQSQQMLIDTVMSQSIEQAYAGVIDYDDQIYMPCQPAGTKILRKNEDEVPIENIKVGDEVISFDRRLSQFIGFYNHGSRVEGISNREYTGDLFEVIFPDNRRTKATKEHKWLVRFIPGLNRKSLWLTYLMFKDGSFKLGQCQIRSVRPDSSDGFGLAVRCTLEGAQSAWILGVHNSLQEAKLQEALNVIMFGITDCAFRSEIGEQVHKIQKDYRDIWDKATACLDYYGRDIRHPFWETNKTRAFNSNFITQSCNLIEGIMEIPLCEGNKTPNWQRFYITKEFVKSLPVFSLKVERHELYVANGILTHNCLFGATWPRFPLVLCDETQDLSVINHVMLEELVDKRVIIVGDPWQSIYAFRGAVQGGMAALVAKFNMVEFPLSMTFRVPKVGVERAKFRVPHIRAPDWQIEGAITHLHEWGPGAIPEGAAIICRNNAPLFSCGLRLLKHNRSIKLIGMEIGPGLLRVMKKLGPASSPPELVENLLDSWLAAELKRAKNPDIIYDKYECLQVLCLNPNARNLGEAITLAQDLFKREGAIQLLSGHKAKGLEWNTVFHLDAWRIPSKWAKEGTEAWEQEMNVRYVIETRFKKEMFFIDSETFNSETLR